MKRLILFSMVLMANMAAAQTKFDGNWYTSTAVDEAVILEVKKNTSEFNVATNQLWLECTNKYKRDTLLLYVLSVDCGRRFWGPDLYPPKKNSLFARCYIVKDQLAIEYTQKAFRENIANWELKTTLHRTRDTEKQR